jgi:hypothetical protein
MPHGHATLADQIAHRALESLQIVPTAILTTFLIITHASLHAHLADILILVELALIVLPSALLVKRLHTVLFASQAYTL